MARFIEGESRTQATLFPEALDEYITEDNPVRVVDVFVDSLDLSGLGFKTQAAETGRPARIIGDRPRLLDDRFESFSDKQRRF